MAVPIYILIFKDSLFSLSLPAGSFFLTPNLIFCQFAYEVILGKPYRRLFEMQIYIQKVVKKRESVSRSVVSNSLWPHGL